uniref:Uncharacterized protein n=1 Tax=Arundo donax TaxID=35708 RepID=A0A0A9BAE5_ARUDO
MSQNQDYNISDRQFQISYRPLQASLPCTACQPLYSPSTS